MRKTNSKYDENKELTYTMIALRPNMVTTDYNFKISNNFKVMHSTMVIAWRQHVQT